MAQFFQAAAAQKGRSEKNVKSLHTPKWLNCDILYYNSLKLQLHKIKPNNTAQNNKISKLFIIKTMLHWERKPDREMRKQGSLELFLSTARHKGTKVNLVLTRPAILFLHLSLHSRIKRTIFGCMEA